MDLGAGLRTLWPGGAAAAIVERVSSLPRRLLESQRASNRETASRWELYGPHRRRVTELLAGAGPGRSLCLLGAGNCNDIDLGALAQRFESIHLVDLDAVALEGARRRQSPDVAARLHLHGGVDLTGVAPRLEGWRRGGAPPAELAALPAAGAARVTATLPRGHDVVASCCVLSQLVDVCKLGLGAEHVGLIEVSCAVALLHLRTLLDLAAPGGAAWLVSDVASSDTYPLVELFGEREPLELLRELSASGNVFTGTDPRPLERELRRSAVLAPLAGASRLEPPWLWTFSDDRTYLVYALEVRRAAPLEAP
jgi:hypothetical protein